MIFNTKAVTGLSNTTRCKVEYSHTDKAFVWRHKSLEKWLSEQQFMLLTFRSALKATVLLNIHALSSLDSPEASFCIEMKSKNGCSNLAFVDITARIGIVGNRKETPLCCSFGARWEISWVELGMSTRFVSDLTFMVRKSHPWWWVGESFQMANVILRRKNTVPKIR